LNLAILFAEAEGLAVPGTDAIEALLSDVEPFERQLAQEAIRDFSLARARGEAVELAELLAPVRVDEWLEIRAPAMLHLDAGRHDLWSESVRELSPWEGKEFRSGRYFEAWYGGERTTIAPQDGNYQALTIDLMVPYEVEEWVALVTVSAPVRAGEWDATVEQLHLQARRVPDSQDSPPTPTFKCKAAMLRGSDGRWRIGCVPGLCDTECTIGLMAGEHGVDSFRCDCDPAAAIMPVDALSSENPRELSA
jgi:hypothetical protein